jgi:hypothetical protein
LDDNAVKIRPRLTFLKLKFVLEKGRVKSTGNRRARMKDLKKVEEAKCVNTYIL